MKDRWLEAHGTNKEQDQGLKAHDTNNKARPEMVRGPRHQWISRPYHELNSYSTNENQDRIMS
jgi:hypothetical protein